MTEDRTRLHWVDTAGGPHLVLPEAIAAAWEGIFIPSGGRVVEAPGYRLFEVAPETLEALK